MISAIKNVKTLDEASKLARQMFGPQAYAYDRANMKAGTWTAPWNSKSCKSGVPQFYVGTGEALYGNGDTWVAAFEAAAKMAVSA